jgi:hypothetical protein
MAEEVRPNMRLAATSTHTQLWLNQERLENKHPSNQKQLKTEPRMRTHASGSLGPVDHQRSYRMTP